MLLHLILQAALLLGANEIGSITQTNDAIGDDFAQILQINDAVINQESDVLNSCDESGDGMDDAQCAAASSNSIGPIVQANTAEGAAESDTVAQSNGAQATQNVQDTNDCDEENTDDNLANCICCCDKFHRLYSSG